MKNPINLCDIPSSTRFYVACGFELGLLVLALVLGKLFHFPVINQLVWEQKDLWWGILATIPLLLLALILLNLNWKPALNFRRVLEIEICPFFADWSWWQLAGVSIMAGVGEEFLFRGFFQGKFTEMGGVVLGLLAASILFGLVHLVTNTYAILATLIGLYLGVLQIWSENLLLAITTHALYDFVVLMWWVRRKPIQETE